MDGRNFDDLARRMGGLASRRTALRALLGGAAMATGLATLPSDHAAATCGGAGARCKRNSACCSGACEWTEVVTRKRRTRVGQCTFPDRPLGSSGPRTPCTIAPDAYACLDTVEYTVQFCGPVMDAPTGYQTPCSSNADCQGVDPACGDELFCFCPLGYRDQTQYWLLKQSCTAMATEGICVH